MVLKDTATMSGPGPTEKPWRDGLRAGKQEREYGGEPCALGWGLDWPWERIRQGLVGSARRLVLPDATKNSEG